MARPRARISIWVVIVSVGAAGTAQAHGAWPSTRAAAPPSHFGVGDRYFDGTAWGLRAYLESIRSTEPELYTKLAPDVERLETRSTAAVLLLGGSLVAGLGTAVYGLTSRPSCTAPSANDPDFGAKVDAWGACNERAMRRGMTFTGVGLGLLLAGGIRALAIAPQRWDYFDFVNRHNSLSPRPMRFELGYDPSRRFAHAGAIFSF